MSKNTELKQLKWIDEHGDDLAGYLERYGRKDLRP